MSTKHCKFISITLFAAGMALLFNPTTHAGDAMILVPAEDSDAPNGDMIPQRRIQEVEDRVMEFKQRRAASSQQQQTREQVQQDTPTLSH